MACFAIISVVLAVLATLAVIKWGGDRFLPNNYDSSTEITWMDINNPIISSPADAFELQQKMISEKEIDSLFLSMGKTDMRNVVGVLTNKGIPNIMKCDIVNEFKAGRAVYENLPAPDAKSDQAPQNPPIAEVKLEKVETTTVTEAPPTRVVTDTVIDGKHYKKIE